MIWGYSEIKDLVTQHSNVKNGLLVDTNILVAATYELDEFNEAAMDLIDSAMELHKKTAPMPRRAMARSSQRRL